MIKSFFYYQIKVPKNLGRIFDAKIFLKPNMIPNLHENCSSKVELEFYESEKSFYCADFNLVDAFISQLKVIFISLFIINLKTCLENVALLFYDNNGGMFIGLVWKSCKESEKARILEQVELLGNGLVQRIETV